METPSELYDMIENRFNFDYRIAFHPYKLEYPLHTDWEPLCYVFPPLTHVKHWTAKCMHELETGRLKRLLLVIPTFAWNSLPLAHHFFERNIKWELMDIDIRIGKLELHILEFK